MKMLETELEYEQALEEVDLLFDAELNTPDGDRLEHLAMLIDIYQEQSYQIKELELIGA